jgi:hypothetical protein
MYHLPSFKTHFFAFVVLLVACLGGSTVLFAQLDRTKWMAVGSLHNWYLRSGCEPEIARRLMVPDQIDGLRWPAQYEMKDTQAAKALWIGATDYYDIVADTVFPHKVVQVGPRDWDEDNEFMPQELKLAGRFDRPAVVVDGMAASYLAVYDSLDEVNPLLEADRMILNVVNTSIGITMKRKIYAFSQQYHDNYFIYEYVFKNTGIVNDTTVNPQPLDSVYFYWQYRYAICKEMSAYGRYFMPQSATWGHNTMNDARGEDPTSGDPFRAQFSWHGLHSGALYQGTNYDNIGAPNIEADGWLTSSQIVGVVTLHADKSPPDNSDDLYQPTTTWYIDSDAPITKRGFHNQYDPVKMAQQYAAMAAGHPPIRHADAVGYCPTCYADTLNGTLAGFSQAHGYGPYSLDPGDSIRIVLAEGAAGLNREKNIEVGYKWFNEIPPYILPDGSTTSDRDEYKDAWVYTGKDSLFQTFNRAIDNFTTGFNIALAPPPPDMFEIISGLNHINLSWSNNAETWPNFAGYRLFRASNRPDTSYALIFECDTSNLVNSFNDSTAEGGVHYYYYVQSFDDGSTNTIQPGVPLVSSKFYTKTNEPAYLGANAIGGSENGHLANSYRLEQNYPNPFNPVTRISYYIPKTSIVDLSIYNMLGQRIRTLVHQVQNAGSYTVRWDGKNNFGTPVASGVYLYNLTAGKFKESRKMILLR